MLERQGHRARSGPHVGDPGRAFRARAGRQESERLLDQGFGVRPRYQHGRPHLEVEAPEFLATQEVGHRLARQAPFHEAPVLGQLALAEWLVEVRVELDPRAVEGARRQQLGVEARAGEPLPLEPPGRPAHDLEDGPGRLLRGGRDGGVHGLIVPEAEGNGEKGIVAAGKAGRLRTRCPGTIRPMRARLTIGCAGATLAAACLLGGAVSATTTRFFRHTTVKDFEEGEATATAVAPPGEVLPGMKATRVAIDAAFAWCAARSRDRATAYFGTGDRGRIFAVGGTGAARQLAEIDAPWVTALAVRPDGNLLAGSTPGGRVFLVDGKSGKSKVFAKLAAEHVWALVHDGGSGTTYVATGDPGQIFALDGKGAARRLWDSGDKHVISLATDGGNLLAGTADQAILYRVHPDGQAEALHDFDADEVRAIVRVKGAIYLAVNDFDNPADAKEPPPPGPQVAKGTRIVPGPAPASAAIPRADAVKARAAIYRLDDSGAIEQLFALPDGYFTALALDARGQLYAASGSQGKLYRIAPDRTVALVADIPERQALSLVPAGDGFLVGSGDVGGIYRVGPAVGAEATYLSKVLDAESPARWGHVWWTGSRDVLIETRSGNTGKPDGKWSTFERLEPVAQHGRENAGQVRSPAARYLQYRATLPSRASTLQDISLYYLPHNQRARVTEVTLGDSPVVAPTATATTASASPTPTPARAHSPILKLRWKAENPDGDELIFKLWFRRDGDALWHPLGGPDPLRQARARLEHRLGPRRALRDPRLVLGRKGDPGRTGPGPFLRVAALPGRQHEARGAVARRAWRQGDRPGARRGLGDLDHRIRRRRRRVAAGAARRWPPRRTRRGLHHRAAEVRVRGSAPGQRARLGLGRQRRHGADRDTGAAVVPRQASRSRGGRERACLPRRTAPVRETMRSRSSCARSPSRARPGEAGRQGRCGRGEPAR